MRGCEDENGNIQANKKKWQCTRLLEVEIEPLMVSFTPTPTSGNMSTVEFSLVHNKSNDCVVKDTRILQILPSHNPKTIVVTSPNAMRPNQLPPSVLRTVNNAAAASSPAKRRGRSKAASDNATAANEPAINDTVLYFYAGQTECRMSMQVLDESNQLVTEEKLRTSSVQVSWSDEVLELGNLMSLDPTEVPLPSMNVFKEAGKHQLTVSWHMNENGQHKHAIEHSFAVVVLPNRPKTLTAEIATKSPQVSKPIEVLSYVADEYGNRIMDTSQLEAFCL